MTKVANESGRTELSNTNEHCKKTSTYGNDDLLEQIVLSSPKFYQKLEGSWEIRWAEE